MTNRIDLYEDEAGGLYLHRPGHTTAFAHVERDMERSIAQFDMLFDAGMRDRWSLFEILAAEAIGGADDPTMWTTVDRIQIDDLRNGGAFVASWSPDDGLTIHDASTIGNLPPGPNAQVMLRARRSLPA